MAHRFVKNDLFYFRLLAIFFTDFQLRVLNFFLLPKVICEKADFFKKKLKDCHFLLADRTNI